MMLNVQIIGCKQKQAHEVHREVIQATGWSRTKSVFGTAVITTT